MEKEERIFVLQVEENDELRNITPYCNGCTFYPCDEECINRKKPITRQEAINRMAKAMIKRYNSERTLTKWEKAWNNKHQKEAYKYFYIDAEAALNALLGKE